MPRGKITGKLVSKSEVQLVAAPKKRGRPVGSTNAAKAARKQSIAKVSNASKTAPVKTKASAPRPHQPAISITVQIPSLRRPKDAAPGKSTTTVQSAPKQTRRLGWVPFVATLIVVAGAAGALLLLPAKKHGIQGGTTTHAAAVRTAPDYQPLVLADQQPTTQSYDGKRNMVSYTTTFSGVRITVSEQALPDNFTRDPTALLRAADGLNAKQRVDTDRGPVFIATNEVAGDQMGVFADKQVLGFIHTNQKMDDSFWKSFIEQLQPADWQNINQSKES